MAGFPFHLLDGLADQETTAAAAAVLHARQDRRQAARRRRLNPDTGTGEDTRSAASGSAEQQRRVDDCEEHFRSAYQQGERATSVAVLNNFRDDPLLRDMLLVSNDSAYPRFRDWLADPGPVDEWKSRDRQQIDSLVSYLQRACAKNDTTSHFGPFAFASLDSPEPVVRWELQERRRLPLLARWAATALGDRMRADPDLLPDLPVRARPTVFRAASSTQLVILDHTVRRHALSDCLHISPPRDLNDNEAQLLDLLTTGPRTVRELCKEMARGSRLDAESVHRHLAQLQLDQLLEIGPNVPYGNHDPIPALLAPLPVTATGHRWRDTLHSLERYVHAFGTSGISERPAALQALRTELTGVTGDIGEREAGRFYSDRAPIHEECLGPIAEVQIGRQIATGIGKHLSLVCELFMLRARHRFHHESALLTDWFAARFGSRGDVGVDEYLEGYLQDLPTLRDRYRTVDATIDRLDAAVRDSLVARVDQDTVVEVPPETIRQLVADWRLDEPAVCNPDVMIAARSAAAIAAGDYRLVVGDLHADEENLTHGLFSPYLAQRFPDMAHQVTEQYRGLLRPGEELADVTLFHRNKTFFRNPLHCVDIELVDASPLSSGSVPFSALRVDHHHGLSLRLGQHEPPVRLVTLPLAWTGIEHNPFVPFGFPQRDGRPIVDAGDASQLPRLQFGRVILQRGQWSVDPAELVHNDRAAAFLAAQQVRRRHVLPRHVYVKSRNEPKPVYCDLDSPLLVRQLTRLARTTQAPLAVQEMLPAPHELWLISDTGPVTSELRCAAFTTQPEPVRHRSRGGA